MDLFNGLWYVVFLAVIIIVSEYLKNSGLLVPFYNFIIDNVKSKKIVVGLISTITGVLPIEGRVTVSAGFLNTIAPTDPEKRKLFGVIDYLSTHHYYFWSPLEKTVIVPMAVLGLSYFQFLNIIWPLLFVVILIATIYIVFVLKEDQIEIKKFTKHNFDINNNCSCYTCRSDNKIKYWNHIKMLLFVTGIIIFGNYIKGFDGQIKELLEGFNNIWIVALLGFVFSFLLGSSSKYAGYVSISSLIFGIQYLPLFIALDYAGYMLSPTHKCFVIGKMYFGTPLKEYYRAIGLLCISIVIVGLFLI